MVVVPNNANSWEKYLCIKRKFAPWTLTSKFDGCIAKQYRLLNCGFQFPELGASSCYVVLESNFIISAFFFVANDSSFGTNEYLSTKVVSDQFLFIRDHTLILLGQIVGVRPV
jgi:hypothetical protein